VARKYARLERAGALSIRDRIWAAIRALDAPGDGDVRNGFSPCEVANLSAQHIDTVLAYFKGLAAAAIVSPMRGQRPAARPRVDFTLYWLARDAGVEAPRVNSEGKPVKAGQGRERMWLALRALRDFNAHELALTASTPEHPVAVGEAQDYLVFLKRAGYVVATAASGARRQACYRFMKTRNTGPRAPLVGRDKSVMDQNTGEVVWQPPK
jgi:hypothetical protein